MKLLTQNTSLLPLNPLHKNQREGMKVTVDESLKPFLEEALKETQKIKVDKWRSNTSGSLKCTYKNKHLSATSCTFIRKHTPTYS